MTKVILTHEVSNLGEAGDLVEVKPGYARNFLLPRKLATPWTKGAEKDIEAMRRARKTRAIATLEDARGAKEALEANVVVVKANAGHGGRLFGTVTTTHVADAIQAAGGPRVDKRKIELGSHIKAVGDYTATIKLHDDIVAKLTIKVIAE